MTCVSIRILALRSSAVVWTVDVSTYLSGTVAGLELRTQNGTVPSLGVWARWIDCVDTRRKTGYFVCAFNIASDTGTNGEICFHNII
jgi:hypothetical protein